MEQLPTGLSTDEFAIVPSIESRDLFLCVQPGLFNSACNFILHS